jgi:hypothetical protein
VSRRLGAQLTAIIGNENEIKVKVSVVVRAQRVRTEGERETMIEERSM